MIAVAGMWEQGWTTPEVEYNLWRFLVTEFQIDAWWMTPALPAPGAKVQQALSLDFVCVKYPELEVIAVDERGEEALPDFVHPKDALYLFGRAGRSALHTSGVQRSVRIPTPEECGRLWPHQALCVLMYDRMLKDGRYSN